MLWNGCINGLNRLQLVLNSYTLFCVEYRVDSYIFLFNIFLNEKFACCFNFSFTKNNLQNNRINQINYLK